MKIETARKAKELIGKLDILEHSFNWFKGNLEDISKLTGIKKHLVDIIIDEIENLKDE